MKMELISPQVVSQLLMDTGKSILNLHKNRIKQQIQIDGSAMPKNKLKTRIRKWVKDSRYPDNTMMDSGSFQRNAFDYYVVNDFELIFRIRDAEHVVPKKYKSKSSRPHTYKQLAEWHLGNGSKFTHSNQSKRLSRHVNFFGLTENDEKAYSRRIALKINNIAKENIFNIIKQSFDLAK